MNPFIVEDSRERYRDRLDEAEQWRLAKPARASRVDQLHMRRGDLLAPGRSEPRFEEAPPA